MIYFVNVAGHTGSAAVGPSPSGRRVPPRRPVELGSCVRYWDAISGSILNVAQSVPAYCGPGGKPPAIVTSGDCRVAELVQARMLACWHTTGKSQKHFTERAVVAGDG
eukprot:CAMPEP_0204423836 /NCGR_PEP_ID=MMETSP0470-20130426/43344_1 /ASSEMBLY_ACC=CAM_ASM_000385 /TAXON_ID=2969 /ORGANISM="Oxyrrhis marina" /LENGTH=107 /DNA_ID=CAMNT_0051421261 /DNA_START=1 /DNA_END=321 /DNA_ORIENTATION=+